MLQLAVLAIAGLLLGAAVGSCRNGAPVALTWAFGLLSAVALGLAVVMLVAAQTS